MTNVVLNTSLGDITIELKEDEAPDTCKNFLDYVRNEHYNNTLFHRVIKGFMIQGGGYEANMREKPTADAIKNEADNGLKNEVGTVAMARTPDPHSATAQFFINMADNDFLNFTAPTDNGWGYTVFGVVIDGMDVASKIEEVATGNSHGHGDVPIDDVIINSCTVQ